MQYLSDEVIKAAMPAPDELAAVARDVIVGLRAGSVITAPRPTLESRVGTRFMAFPAILESEGIAGVKWLGITPNPSTAGRVGSIIALSRIEDAQPFAILDGRWITAVRTAVVSFLAGLAIAKPDSRKIAFLACGEQAQLHLDIFARHFGIREVAAYSRTVKTARRFAARALHDLGCTANFHSSIRDCVEGADIVITSTPGPADIKLRAEWLTPSCFCSLVDLGRSFVVDTLPRGTLFVVDDIAQFHALNRDGKIAPFDSVAPVAMTDVLDRGDEATRNGGFLMPTGLGAIDIRIACEIFRRVSAQVDGSSTRWHA